MSYNLKQQYANSLPRYYAQLTPPFYPERPQPPKDDRLFQAYRTPTTFNNQMYIGFKPDVPRPLFPGWSSSNQVLKDDTSLKSGVQRQEKKQNDRGQSSQQNQVKGQSSSHPNPKPIQITDQWQQKYPLNKQYISTAQKTSKQILKNKQIGIQSSMNQKYTQNILNIHQDKYFNNNLINLNNNNLINNINNNKYSYTYNNNNLNNANHNNGITAYGINSNQYNLTNRYEYGSRDDGILGNNRSNSQPSVYQARSLPKAFLHQHPATQKYYDPSAVSYNSFLQKCGLNNANYIQQTYGNIQNYHQYLKQRYGQYLNISNNNADISSLPQNNPTNLPLQNNILKQSIAHRPHYNNSIIVPPEMNSFYNNSNISSMNNGFNNNSYLNSINGNKNIMNYYNKSSSTNKYEDPFMKQYNKYYNYNNINNNNNNSIENNNSSQNNNKILQQKDQLKQIKNDKLNDDFTLLNGIKIEFQKTNHGNSNRLKSKSNRNVTEVIQLIDSDDNDEKEREKQDKKQNANAVKANNNNTNQNVYNANSNNVYNVNPTNNMPFNTQHLSQNRRQKAPSPYFNHSPSSNHPSSHLYRPSYHQSGKQYKQQQQILPPYLQKTKPISKFNQPSKFFKENKHDLSRQKLEDLRKMKQCRKYQEDLTNSLNTPPVNYKNGGNGDYGLIGDTFSNNTTGFRTKNPSFLTLGTNPPNGYKPIRISNQEYNTLLDSIKSVNESYTNRLKTNNKNSKNKDIDQVINNINKQSQNAKQNSGRVRSIEELKMLEQLYGEHKNFGIDAYHNSRGIQSAFNMMKDKNNQSNSMNYMERFKHGLLGNVVYNNSQIDGKGVNLIPSNNSIISNKQIAGNQHVRKQAQKAYLKSRTRLINTSNNAQLSQINSQQQKNITSENSFQKKRSNMVSALNSSAVGDKNKNQFNLTAKNIQGMSQSQKIVKQALTAEQRASLTIQWTPKLKKLKQLIKRRENDSVIMIGPEFQAQLPQFITDSDKLKTLILIKRSNLMKRMYCCN